MDNEEILFENKEREITITATEEPKLIRLKFGDIEVSINKDIKVRDIAVMVEKDVGVCWDDTELRHSSITLGGLRTLFEKADELETVKDAFRILNKEG